MSEFRRILIEPHRIFADKSSKNLIQINKSEYHYLKRVLRLNSTDYFEVIDGVGSLWTARINDNESIILLNDRDSPKFKEPKKYPLIVIGFALPKNDVDTLIRMCCEIGVDIFQPIISERTIQKRYSESRKSRYESIIKESIEQSERLWKPNILRPITLESWLESGRKKNPIALANTRMNKSFTILCWLKKISNENEKISITIGPEGGWSEKERLLANRFECPEVDLGTNVLRSSTAAVVAAQQIENWRSAIDADAMKNL